MAGCAVRQGWGCAPFAASRVCRRRSRAMERGVAQTVTWWPAGPQRSSLTQIIIRDGDSFEVALKKFGRNVQQAGILSEAKRRRHYEPPSVKRKRKADARRRKERKAAAKAAARGY